MVRKLLSLLLTTGPKHSVFQAICYVFLSILVCVPSALWLLFPEQTLTKKKTLAIKNICLKTDSSIRLPVILFSEILNISSDQPTLLHNFSTTYAEEVLRQTRVFSSISVKKSSENKGLIITYSLHSPMAYLGNLKNTLINHEGLCFPCHPFFKPMNLPTVFINEEDLINWKASDEVIQILHLILEKLDHKQIETIDLSHLHTYPEEIFVRVSCGDLLRLRRNNTENGLSCYLQTKQHLRSQTQEACIYDLRFPDYLLFSPFKNLK